MERIRDYHDYALYKFTFTFTLKERQLYFNQAVKTFDDMSIHKDTVPSLDRQTDRQTDRQKCHNNIALCMHCMPSGMKQCAEFIKRINGFFKRTKRFGYI